MNTTSRKEFLKMAGAMALAMLPLPPSWSAVRRAEGNPNVILILADDLGYAELGCYGQKLIRTANIGQLALDGMRFTQCYSGSSVSAPSRCVLLTGMHTGHAFIRDNLEIQPEGQLPLPEDTVTIAQLLQTVVCCGEYTQRHDTGCMPTDTMPGGAGARRT